MWSAALLTVSKNPRSRIGTPLNTPAFARQNGPDASDDKRQHHIRAGSGYTPSLFGAAAMRLAQYVKFREEKFGGVLFETRSEKVFTLNTTAAAIVREIISGHSGPEIALRLKERYADHDGAIAHEVVAVIAELRQKGLIED